MFSLRESPATLRLQPRQASQVLAPSQRISPLAELLALRLQELGAHGVIKLHGEDFEQALDSSGFWHINAMPCTNQVARRYALARIVPRAPDFSPPPRLAGREVATLRPLLDLADNPLVRCVELRTFESCALVPEALQRQLLGCAPHVGESPTRALGRVMTQRYGQVRGWRDSSCEWRSVVVTRFESDPLP